PCPEVWTIDAPPEQTLPHLDLDPTGDQRVLIDATEHRISRPVDGELQQAYYSGKKHGHMLKTQFATDDQHHILAISVAVAGAIHDKALCDQLRTLERLPDDCEAAMDKGYQGVANQVPLMAITDPMNGAVG